jgi:hypothetical protein
MFLDYVPQSDEGIEEHKGDSSVPQPRWRPEERKLPHPILSSVIPLSSVFSLHFPAVPVCPGLGRRCHTHPGPDQPASGNHRRSSRLQDVVVDGAIDVEVGADGLGWRG